MNSRRRQQLHRHASAGYIFANWSGDCTGTGACELSNVTSAKSVTANFTVRCEQDLYRPDGHRHRRRHGYGFGRRRHVRLYPQPAIRGGEQRAGRPAGGLWLPPRPVRLHPRQLHARRRGDLTITYPTALPAGTVYWKYGPTPGNASPTWYKMPATLAGNTATFTITDGGLGDDDLTANGSIVDQGGPGVPGAVDIPTLSEWASVVVEPVNRIERLAAAAEGVVLAHRNHPARRKTGRVRCTAHPKRRDVRCPRSSF